MIAELLILSFWASIAVTEAFKWRVDPDVGPLVSTKSYHVWRVITTGSVYGLAVYSTSWIVGTLMFMIGNLIYERMISYVQLGNFLAKREDFKIMGFNVKRPPVAVELAAIAALFLALLGAI